MKPRRESLADEHHMQMAVEMAGYQLCLGTRRVGTKLGSSCAEDLLRRPQSVRMEIRVWPKSGHGVGLHGVGQAAQTWHSAAPQQNLILTFSVNDNTRLFTRSDYRARPENYCFYWNGRRILSMDSPVVRHTKLRALLSLPLLSSHTSSRIALENDTQIRSCPADGSQL